MLQQVRERQEGGWGRGSEGWEWNGGQRDGGAIDTDIGAGEVGSGGGGEGGKRKAGREGGGGLGGRIGNGAEASWSAPAPARPTCSWPPPRAPLLQRCPTPLQLIGLFRIPRAICAPTRLQTPSPVCHPVPSFPLPLPLPSSSCCVFQRCPTLLQPRSPLRNTKGHMCTCQAPTPSPACCWPLNTKEAGLTSRGRWP